MEGTADGRPERCEGRDGAERPHPERSGAEGSAAPSASSSGAETTRASSPGRSSAVPSRALFCGIAFGSRCGTAAVSGKSWPCPRRSRRPGAQRGSGIARPAPPPLLDGEPQRGAADGAARLGSAAIANTNTWT